MRECNEGVSHTSIEGLSSLGVNDGLPYHANWPDTYRSLKAYIYLRLTYFDFFLPKLIMQLSNARLASPSRFLARMYVGPPDPISHMRPVVYDNVAQHVKRPKNITNHPYSLSEFSTPPSLSRRSGFLAHHSEQMLSNLESLQLHARLQTISLDQMNHRFWSDNNARFMRAKQEYSAYVSPETPASLELMSPFYREWLRTNSARLRRYNRLLWATTYRVIFAQMHAGLVSFYTRIIVRLAGSR